MLSAVAGNVVAQDRKIKMVTDYFQNALEGLACGDDLRNK